MSAWAGAIRKVMREISFQPCMFDADVWMISDLDTSAIEYSGVTSNRYAKILPTGERYW